MGVLSIESALDSGMTLMTDCPVVRPESELVFTLVEQR